MNFLKKLLGKQDSTIQSYDDFWAWFQDNEQAFHKVVKNSGDFERVFNKLSQKLNELREGYFFLVGMQGSDTAELVFTADGQVKNFIFVEELVNAAPVIKGWKFTAHKPALDIENVSINMGGYEFSQENLNFFPVENSDYPDEIVITVVHDQLNEDNSKTLTNGVYIFLDNYLGELNFATVIDSLNVDARKNNGQELVPIGKLKDYLIWRQKEFVEKYEGIRHDTENDQYAAFEAKRPNGNPLIAVMNTDLIHWDKKASHPWIFYIEIWYGKPTANQGMPDDATYALLDEIEKEVTGEMKDFEGYLNVGRQTADGVRVIYFACKDFRKAPAIADKLIHSHGDKFTIKYDIYKDKYWRTFDKFA